MGGGGGVSFGGLGGGGFGASFKARGAGFGGGGGLTGASFGGGGGLFNARGAGLAAAFTAGAGVGVGAGVGAIHVNFPSLVTQAIEVIREANVKCGDNKNKDLLPEVMAPLVVNWQVAPRLGLALMVGPHAETEIDMF